MCSAKTICWFLEMLTKLHHKILKRVHISDESLNDPASSRGRDVAVASSEYVAVYSEPYAACDQCQGRAIASTSTSTRTAYQKAQYPTRLIYYRLSNSLVD
jgi:hypothetical protein